MGYEYTESSFVLKTRRIEYTLEYFKNIGKPQTLKERADIIFMDDLRF